MHIHKHKFASIPQMHKSMIHRWVNAPIQTYVNVSTRAHIHSYMQICTKYIFTNMHPYICACTFIYMHANVTYLNNLTHTHAYTCACFPRAHAIIANLVVIIIVAAKHAILISQFAHHRGFGIYKIIFPTSFCTVIFITLRDLYTEHLSKCNFDNQIVAFFCIPLVMNPNR